VTFVFRFSLAAFIDLDMNRSENFYRISSNKYANGTAKIGDQDDVKTQIPARTDKIYDNQSFYGQILWGCSIFNGILVYLCGFVVMVSIGFLKVWELEKSGDFEVLKGAFSASIRCCFYASVSLVLILAGFESFTWIGRFQEMLQISFLSASTRKVVTLVAVVMFAINIVNWCFRLANRGLPTALTERWIEVVDPHSVVIGRKTDTTEDRTSSDKSSDTV